MVDLTGKAYGRGAYLHDKRSCWHKGMKGALDHALKTQLTDQEKEDLRIYMQENIPEEESMQMGAEG